MDGTRDDGERFGRGAAATRAISPRVRNAAAVTLILFTLSLYIDGKPFEPAFTTMIKSRRCFYRNFSVTKISIITDRDGAELFNELYADALSDCSSDFEIL
ncbi:unnamed protein product [Heterotrigona itama]|uniref:Uncharacterized protein n=1 Tax=Heterotrigona itama TaxID=395501 RepID=A0A6V7HG21_9HYME|nr:unnamed protein product [Heterotrigona itama]